VGHKEVPVTATQTDAGRASLILHRNHSSSNHVLAPARQPEVCPEAVGGTKMHQNFPRRAKPVPIFQVLPTAEVVMRASAASDSWCLKFFRQLNTHSPAASAANAGGFLQTSLSEVIRRSPFRLASAIARRITPDRVIASASRTRRTFHGPTVDSAVHRMDARGRWPA
jgi:hypothetical protein